jgi:hypothetical protein
MSVVIPIDNLAEVLFENAENVNSEVYLKLMNLMKQYHDHENNHDELINYINTLSDNELKAKLKKYIKKVESPCCRKVYLFMCLICSIFPFFGILTGFIYVITTKK